jgi:hypothetical protein
MARSHWASNPFDSFEKVIDRIARSIQGARLKKPVERSKASAQADWFEIGSAVLAARAEMLRGHEIRALVNELRALTGIGRVRE